MLGTQLDQLKVQAARMAFEGAFMPEAVARNIANAAKILNETIAEGASRKREEFRARARASQVDDLWESACPSAVPTQDAATASTPAAVRRYNPATGRID